MNYMRVYDQYEEKFVDVLPLKAEIHLNDAGGEITYAVVLKCIGASIGAIEEIIVFESDDQEQAIQIRREYRDKISEIMARDN